MTAVTAVRITVETIDVATIATRTDMTSAMDKRRDDCYLDRGRDNLCLRITIATNVVAEVA